MRSRARARLSRGVTLFVVAEYAWARRFAPCAHVTQCYFRDWDGALPAFGLLPCPTELLRWPTQRATLA
jgi:hypothetical protein